MGDGDVRGRGDGGERRHAGDHLERQTGARERDRLLPTTPEQVRIAALQPHDAPAAAGMRNQERIHFGLWQAVARDSERLDRRLVEQLRRDQPVVHEHVTRAHVREPLDRDQLGIARAGADERYRHASAFVTASRKKSRRSS